MTFIKQLLITVSLTLGLVGLSQAQEIPKYKWQYDKADNAIYVKSYTGKSRQPGYLYMGKDKKGQWTYVYYPAKQPVNCIGHVDSYEAIEFPDGIIVGKSVCRKTDHPLRLLYTINSDFVSALTKAIGSDKSIELGGDLFTTKGFQEAAAQIN